MDALAGRPPRRQSRRIRRAALLSLLVHLAIGVLLLITIRREGKPEQLPPPSAVTMLFESGRKNGPTLPNPEPQATPSSPAVPEAQPIEERPLPTPPLPPAAEPPPPAPQEPTAPVISPPTPEPPAPALPEPPAPPIEVPPPPPPAAEPVPVPPPPAAAEPVPVSPPPPAIRPSQAPRPPPVRPPAKPHAPPKPSDFPAPTDFSFGTPRLASPAPARPRSAPHIPGTIDMSMGPATKGTADVTPLGDQDLEGADWRNALSRWVAEHAYYPEQAARNLEEGDAKVHVIVEPSGRVKEVELIGKSGSMWLDLALLALFRDQQIPRLPYGINEPVDFDFTMHYILIRQP